MTNKQLESIRKRLNIDKIAEWMEKRANNEANKCRVTIIKRHIKHK